MGLKVGYAMAFAIQWDSITTNLLEHSYDRRAIRELLGHKDVATTTIYTHVLNRGGKTSGVRRTEPRRFRFIRIRIKTERPSPAFDNLLITRDLTERSARFYTEENLGRRVLTERNIHCLHASSHGASSRLLSQHRWNLSLLDSL